MVDTKRARLATMVMAGFRLALVQPLCLDWGMDTPTPLPEPPRTVRGGGGAVWFIRIFIMPHMLVGVVVAALFTLTVATALIGTDTKGTVLSTHKSRSRKGGRTYSVEYRYYAGWRAFTNSDSVSWQLYEQIAAPQKLEGQPALVKVRYFVAGPLHHHVLTEEHSAWSEAGFLLLFTLFWNGILSIFVYLAWIQPLRRRWLIRHGQAVPGQI